MPSLSISRMRRRQQQQQLCDSRTSSSSSPSSSSTQRGDDDAAAASDAAGGGVLLGKNDDCDTAAAAAAAAAVVGDARTLVPATSASSSSSPLSASSSGPLVPAAADRTRAWSLWCGAAGVGRAGSPSTSPRKGGGGQQQRQGRWFCWCCPTTTSILLRMLVANPWFVLFFWCSLAMLLLRQQLDPFTVGIDSTSSIAAFSASRRSAARKHLYQHGRTTTNSVRSVGGGAAAVAVSFPGGAAWGSWATATTAVPVAYPFHELRQRPDHSSSSSRRHRDHGGLEFDSLNELFKGRIVRDDDDVTYEKMRKRMFYEFDQSLTKEDVDK